MKLIHGDPKMVHETYNWQGWQTVEELASRFGKTKRRIQQVLKDLLDLGEADQGILVRHKRVYYSGLDLYRIESIATPIYKRTEVKKID